MTVAQPIVKRISGSGLATAIPAPPPVPGSPPVPTSVSGSPSAITSAQAKMTFGGTVLNNFAMLYTADRFRPYSLPAHLAYGLNACTPTGNPLNAGPVWNRCTEDERDWAQLARWGVNLVTLGVDWGWWGGSDPNTFQARQAFAVLDQMIAWGNKYGIYLTIVMDVPPGGNQGFGGSANVAYWGNFNSFSLANPSSTLTSLMIQHRDWWLMFANRYAKEPQIFAYDLLNEPSSLNIFSQWYPLAAYLFDQIRTVDANHTILVQTGADNQFHSQGDLTSRAFGYCTHMYGPLQMTSSNGPNGLSYPGPGPDSGSPNSTSATDAHLTGDVAPFQIAVASTTLANSGYPQAGSFTIASPAGEVLTVNVVDATHINCTARNVNGLGTGPINVGDLLPIATYITADPGVGGQQIQVANTANFRGTYITFAMEDVNYTAVDATHFGTVGTPAARHADGTTAAAAPVGTVVRDGWRYWQKSTLRYVFSTFQGGRSDLGFRVTYLGEEGSRKYTPGYAQLCADYASLCQEANWLNAACTQFQYRGYNANDYGCVNGDAGAFLSSTPITPAQMSFVQAYDNTLITAMQGVWPGNAYGRVY